MMTRDLTGMMFPKPQRYPDLNEMRQLRAEGKLFIQRKRDGQRHVVLITPEGAQIFDRNLRRIFHFEELIAAFTAFGLPAGTLLDIEITIDLPGGADDFSTISSLNKAGLEKAIRMVNRLTRAPRAMLLDIFYCGEKATYSLPFRVRHQTLMNAFDGKHPTVYVTKNLEGTVDECMALAIAEKWEGLVFWATEQTTKIGYGKTVPRLNSWKWKNTKEEDFICTGWEPTSAEPGAPMFGVVGALKLSEMRNGKLTSVGGVGTGLTLVERREALSWTYPCVVEVVYDERTPTGAVRFPRFVRLRTDKSVAEVSAEGSSVRDNASKGDAQYAPRGVKGTL
jgi:ATP-dependent DNA ligase